MHVPNRENAEVPLRKVTEYLLDRNHPDASDNAKYFLSHGFSGDRPHELIAALQRHAREHEVVNARTTPYGITYAVEGRLAAPDGGSPPFRSVWFAGSVSALPRFVTAYPVKGFSGTM